MTLNDKLGFGEDAVFVSDRDKSVSTTGQYNIFSTQNPSGTHSFFYRQKSSVLNSAGLVSSWPSWASCHRATVPS